MKVYCSHSQTINSKSSNFYRCRLCGAEWYGYQVRPLILLGCTEVTEVDPDYYEKSESKEPDLKIVRCDICHDVIGYREHYFCKVKGFFQDFHKQQRLGLTFSTISIVIILLVVSALISEVLFK